jgi:hypothetical protein
MVTIALLLYITGNFNHTDPPLYSAAFSQFRIALAASGPLIFPVPGFFGRIQIFLEFKYGLGYHM